MVNFSALTISQKIKNLREEKKLPQYIIADALGISHAKASLLETGSREYSYEELELVKKHLGISKAPLTQFELEVFKEKLYAWLDCIRDGHFEEAKKQRKRLAVIRRLPFEKDLMLLYDLMEIRLFIRQHDVKAAEDALAVVTKKLDYYVDENMYHYYYCVGSIHLLRYKPKEALQAFTHIYNNKFDEVVRESTLEYNIGVCYSLLGKHMLAIMTTERNEQRQDDKRNMQSGLTIAITNNQLGLDYLKLGHIETALEHFNTSLLQAKLADHKRYICYALHNIGYAYSVRGDYRKAFKYLEESEEYLEKGSHEYVEFLYRKYRCFIDTNAHPVKTEAYINEAIKLSKKFGDEEYELLFKFLHCLANLKTGDNAQYIEEVAIPYLLSKYYYSEALDYCQKMQEFYIKRSKLKSNNRAERSKYELKAFNFLSLRYEISAKMIEGR